MLQHWASSDSLSGFRLVDIILLGQMFSQLLCPSCSEATIELRASPIRRSAMNTKLSAYCTTCKSTQASSSTSETVPRSLSSVSAIGTVAASRNCGFGYEQLCRFFCWTQYATNFAAFLYISTDRSTSA